MHTQLLTVGRKKICFWFILMTALSKAATKMHVICYTQNKIKNTYTFLKSKGDTIKS